MMVDPLGLWPTGCILGAIGGGGASLIGGGNWKEALCNGAMGCAIGELTEYIIQAFPETGASLAKCAIGAIAGGVAGQAGSGICGALFGDCPKDPLDWRCMAQSGLVGAVIGCAGGFVDDGILGAVLGIVGESLGLAVGSGCSNDIW